MKSAIFSYSSLLFVFDLIDKNERTQLLINKTIATNVISSMIVLLVMLNNLREVRRIKQIPSKLEEAESMWDDFPLLSSI